jgi:hypothetical protein
MSAATASQPTPAHQLRGHESLNSTTTNTSAKHVDTSIPSGPVEADLSFYDPPKDGSKVILHPLSLHEQRLISK